MHIIIGLITGLATLLYIMDRLGLDVGWLNPWAWRRRRAWAKKYEGDPIYSIEDPVHAAAILIVGAARLEGDPCSEQKETILGVFETGFSLDRRAANELYTSATHLLGSPQVIESQLTGLADRSRIHFNDEQCESFLEMLAQVTDKPSGPQQAYVATLRGKFMPEEPRGAWG